MGLSRIFKKREPHPLQPVRVHYRRLRYYDKVPGGPNLVKIAHWSLQVGDNFYELAEPLTDILKLDLRERLEQHNNDEDSDKGDSDADDDDNDDKDEDEDENDEDEDDEDEDDEDEDNEDEDDEDEDDEDDEDEDDLVINLEDLALENAEMYQALTANSVKIPGRKVPLQISKGRDWWRLKDAKTVDLGYTRVPAEKVKERAIHIFNMKFREDYDFWYYNCQAFVVFLFFSLRIIGGPKPQIKKPFRVDSTNATLLASYACYQTWKHIVGEPVEEPILGSSREWSYPEKYLNYGAILPPRFMKEQLEVGEAPPPRKPGNRAPPAHHHRHVEPRSHATHTNNALHQSMVGQQNTMLNAASIGQQQSTIFASNPNLFSGTFGGAPMGAF